MLHQLAPVQASLAGLWLECVEQRLGGRRMYGGDRATQR
jgi:hypothetical protein